MSMERLADELAILKDELGALASDQLAAAASASREKLDGAARLLNEALHDVEGLVAREEENIENMIAARPLASVAAAFVAAFPVSSQTACGRWRSRRIVRFAARAASNE